MGCVNQSFPTGVRPLVDDQAAPVASPSSARQESPPPRQRTKRPNEQFIFLVLLFEAHACGQ